jgi:carbon monoxide dehydrogenase subunit G
MTLAFQDRRILPASPESVWSTLTDFSRAAEWMPGVADMRADGPLAVGTLLHYRAQGREQTSTVSALDPGRSLTLTSERSGVRADYRYDLEPEGSGTAVALSADVVTSGPMRLLGGVIRSAIAKADGAQLERLGTLF